MRTVSLTLLFALGACDPGTPADDPTLDLTDETTRVSYAIGMNVGQSFERDQLDLDIDAVAAGIRAAVGEAEPELSDEEAMTILQTFGEERRQAQVEEQARAGTANLEEAEAFLAENAEREEITVTESGLQYEVVEQGDGPSPTADDRVQVHYRGTLLDGTEFDSSYERGQPATFATTQVIPGWTEALQLMQVGDKWNLYIPPDLAYGERGSPPRIEPNSALIFEVELLDIE